jgi:hypothetical protein
VAAAVAERGRSTCPDAGNTAVAANYVEDWKLFYNSLEDDEEGDPEDEGEFDLWLQKVLFPDEKDYGFGCGVGTGNFPGGLARVPFVWKYSDKEFAMEFLGGFVGVRQEQETLTLRPEIGWAVREAGATNR